MVAIRLALVAAFAAATVATEPVPRGPLEADDACLAGGDASCDLNALQHGARLRGPALELAHVGANVSGHANHTAEQLPNIQDAITQVGDIAQSAIKQAAATVNDYILQGGSFTNAAVSSVVKYVGDSARSTIGQSSDAVKDLLRKANSYVASANLTVPGLTEADIDVYAQTLTAAVAEAEGAAKGMSQEQVFVLKGRLLEVVSELNSTAQAGTEDAEQAAKQAAERVATVLDTQFEQLAPAVQEKILEVVVSAAVQVESMQKVAIDTVTRAKVEEKSSAVRAACTVALLASSALAVLLA